MRLKSLDRVISIFLFISSVILFIINETYPDYVKNYTQMLILLLGLSSLGTVFGRKNKFYADKFNKGIEKINPKNIFTAIVSLLIYIIAITIIGYFPGTVIFISVLLLLLGVKDWETIVITNTFFVLLVYILFIIFLKIKLPMGIIFEGWKS